MLPCPGFTVCASLEITRKVANVVEIENCIFRTVSAFQGTWSVRQSGMLLSKIQGWCAVRNSGKTHGHRSQTERKLRSRRIERIIAFKSTSNRRTINMKRWSSRQNEKSTLYETFLNAELVVFISVGFGMQESF